MKKGDIVKGRITNIKSYGAFVKIDDNFDGLIHISEVSDAYVQNIEDYFSVGDVVKLEILEVVSENKLSLSYKLQNKVVHKKRENIKLIHGFKPLEKKLDEWVKNYFNKR